MIQIVFFDFDGTLFSHNRRGIPPGAMEAIRTLRAHGVHVVLATGRHHRELRRLLKEPLPFDGYILLNGQLCLDRDGHRLLGHPIRDAAVIKKLFSQKEFTVQILAEDDSYINFVSPNVTEAMEAVSTPMMPIMPFHSADIYQAIVFVDESMQLDLAAQLPHSRIARWHSKAMDVIDAEGGKAVGISAYLKHIGISPSEAMAFGDGENDAEMLRAVEIGIAMGNACQCTKDAADYVTADIDDEGVACAIAHFIELGAFGGSTS